MTIRPQTSDRVIRVFVSSTFRDMQAERDELVLKIFPQLRRLCEERGVTWGEIDLRWGITEEQSQCGEVLPICLEETRSDSDKGGMRLVSGSGTAAAKTSSAAGAGVAAKVAIISITRIDADPVESSAARGAARAAGFSVAGRGAGDRPHDAQASGLTSRTTKTSEVFGRSVVAIVRRVPSYSTSSSTPPRHGCPSPCFQ